MVYSASRFIYNIYFHPLAKFPGPKLAAVLNIWYAYHWFSGRYPWAIEAALKKYGDTDFQNRGKNLGGIVWDEDPVRHREVAKKLAPAFSMRRIRAMEPIVVHYIEEFISRMKKLGGAREGVGLAKWMNWLTMDTSADLATGEKMSQMRNLKDSLDLDVLLAFNWFATVLQVFKRFPLLMPLQYFFAPFSKLIPFFRMEAIAEQVFALTENDKMPKSKEEFSHLGAVSLQIMFAGFGTMSDWYYSTIIFLLQSPITYNILIAEIREAFDNYESITSEKLSRLEYLNACLQESLRLLPSLNTGLARLSPGANVDGVWTHVQTSVFTVSRSDRYFHDPLTYSPQRWLTPDHPLYDEKFNYDNLKAMFSFSLGSRGCVGKELAWMQGRLFFSKLRWNFDVKMGEGQDVNLEMDLIHYGFFAKPEVNVRFISVDRKS
ncbi:hypothetical protein HYALB_00013363 [Hymenoscyphus albidus]|uniref:Cytochrome P450 n=1 Tax=Hymenoscyphus albidus TaxID=595503 RepID=A0A9N9LRF0_9HELO|nr:hypothetical protein HYALB_00013363 [Hymenoscyphus albidus]